MLKCNRSGGFATRRGGIEIGAFFYHSSSLFSLENNLKQSHSDVTAVIAWNLLNRHAEHRIHPFIHLDF